MIAFAAALWRFTPRYLQHSPRIWRARLTPFVAKLSENLVEVLSSSCQKRQDHCGAPDVALNTMDQHRLRQLTRLSKSVASDSFKTFQIVSVMI